MVGFPSTALNFMLNFYAGRFLTRTDKQCNTKIHNAMRRLLVWYAVVMFQITKVMFQITKAMFPITKLKYK